MSLRRILQIGVDQHDGIAPGVVHPGSDRDLVAEVAGEVHNLDTLILCMQLAHDLRRAVAAAVIHQNQFPRLPRTVQHLADAPVQLMQHTFFIETGRYD